MTAPRRDPLTPRLTLVSRAECPRCEEFLEELGALRGVLKPELPGFPEIEVVDVDADPVLQRRWGLKVPVLLLAGVPVCEHWLDVPELKRLLRL